ncbi:CBS domain-containing protein [Pseudohalioglobus sediminis]|uniref:CBS domain-containing protein n=1 Tax=Pseudohalioglobus sediminis TaxID=2606449 RepID=A0A5B0X4U0_9GAMM|nr:CBS domain-containing protein [Pseudohalioglobus sediminis]KAA1194420.1 CBS domain-containing protein [Pseudohalioglobus sediminis]
MFSVAEIMTPNPFTLGPDESLSTARRLMSEKHIRHIPVVDDAGALVGIVSQRDVLAAADSSVLPDTEAHLEEERYVALSAIMTSPVQTVEENASLRGTALQLLQSRTGCMPVTRSGKLVGIITDTDFISIAINLMEQLEQAEPDLYDFDEGFNDGEI